MDDASAVPPAATPAGDIARLRAEVRGAVQGVGFRPFVFRLASELELKVWVTNDTRGVFVEVEGPRERLVRFLARLASDAPRVARIHSLEHAWLEPADFARFEIRHEDGAREYGAAADRRFHAQPIACPKGGPSVRYRTPFEDLPPALRSSGGDAALEAATNAILRGDASR